MNRSNDSNSARQLRLSVCSVLLFSGSVFVLSGIANAAPTDIDSWLAANRVQLDGQVDPYASDPRYQSGRVFLLGEVHGIAHGQEADLVFLKQLHRHNRVRAYVGEFDPVQAEAFNEYLETGDSRRLDSVFAAWRARGLQWANQDFRAKIAAIREWNQTLPRRQRIRFLGADEIQDMPAACAWLASRLPNRHHQPSIVRLGALARDPAKCAKGGALPALARDLADRDLQALEPAVSNLVAALQIEASDGDREARIAANIRRYLSKTRSNLYGLWGLYHVVQAKVNGTSPMALRLSQDGVAVRTTVMLNLNGAMMIPTQQDDGKITYSAIPYSVDSEDAALIQGIEPFSRASNGKMTMFPLAREGSPFERADSLTRVGGRFGRMQPFSIDIASAPSGFWADWVLISRGSPATKPLAD